MKIDRCRAALVDEASTLHTSICDVWAYARLPVRCKAMPCAAVRSCHRNDRRARRECSRMHNVHLLSLSESRGFGTECCTDINLASDRWFL